MVSAHDGCSYHQAKTPIGFWCRRDLNPGQASLREQTAFILFDIGWIGQWGSKDNKKRVN
jgi:hypothetical protein